ncbi:MAG: hypothetical protein J2P25_08245 [Nocardiopsaceae bacterium]|nr:hypothetical protein [Nocardiopsaceae bacterium]
MRDDTEHVAELEMLRAQRAQLASHLKTPWWYVAAMAAGWAVVCATPIGTHYIPNVGAWGGVLAIMVFYLLQNALARVTGVALGTQTLRYPSGRAWGIAVIVVIVAASEAEALLVENGLLGAAIVVGVFATLAGTACWRGHLQGIRRDLETGREAI